MTAKELVSMIGENVELEVKMRYIDDNRFVDADVVPLKTVSYSDGTIVFYLDR